MTLQQVAVTGYLTPLREGGSLPGIVEGDDLGTYVCKFRGAGQGIRVLVAETIVASLASALGLRTPRLVELDLDAELARYEADEEVQDLITASVGSNLGVDFLPGSFGFDPTIEVAEDFAATVLWLDAYVANVDRSWRNPNLLVWHGEPWVIDHGAALYFHHSWSADAAGPSPDPERFARQPFAVADHIFEKAAPRARELDAELARRVDDAAIEAAVDAVPAAWLAAVGPQSPERYREFLRARRDVGEGSRQWLP